MTFTAVRSTNAKELALGILTVAAGIASAYLWLGVISAGEFKQASFYSLPVIALFIFAVLFSLACAFIQSKLIRRSTAALALASNYILIPFNPGILWAVGASGLGAWYASEQIANEQAASNFFSARKILKSGLPVFFTSLAIVLAVFYFSVSGQGLSASLIPRSLFDAAIPLLREPLQQILPGFRADASVDQLLLAFVASQAGKELDVAKLPPAEKEALLRQGRQALTQQFGINLTGKEKSADVLYELANAQVAKLAGPFQKYLPVIAVVGFFLAIKTLTFPVYWLTLILVFLVVRLLVAINVLKEKTAIIEVSRIEF